MLTDPECICNVKHCLLVKDCIITENQPWLENSGRRDNDIAFAHDHLFKEFPWPACGNDGEMTYSLPEAMFTLFLPW